MNWVNEKLGNLRAGVMRIVVSHHPFDLLEGRNPSCLVGRARLALKKFANHVDIFLAGHLHVGHSGPGSLGCQGDIHPALVLQAGTATSLRRRGEVNSFNVLRIDRWDVAIEQYQWNPKQGLFATSKVEGFRRGEKGWAKPPS